jgi:hypothetical protein
MMLFYILGSVPARGLAKSPLSYLQRHPKFHRSSSVESLIHHQKKEKPPVNFRAPIQIIIGLEVSYIILFLGIYYTGWQMVITAMSTLFKHTYGLTDMQTGLTFISNGVGCVIGTLTTGKFLDVDYRRFRSHYHDTPEHFPLEHARLRTMWFWSSLACASVLVFG